MAATTSSKTIVLNEQQLADLVNQVKAQVKAEMLAEKPATSAKGIGKAVYDLLESVEHQHLSYKQIAELISAKFDSKTSAGCISWYISHKRNYGRNPLPRRSSNMG